MLESERRKSSIITACLLAVAASIVGPSAMADDDSLSVIGQRLDESIPDLLVEDGVPGAVIAVGRRSGDRYESVVRTYGSLRIEPDRSPMPENAVFDMASVTKPVAAATSLMILVDRGKLKLDDSVAKYLPEFDAEARRGVTVRQLLTHTSGLPPYLSMKTRDELKSEHGFPCAAAIRESIRSTPISGEPGERVTYSCLNAVLVAEIVERVNGKALDAFAAENIFGPLEMKDTGFRPPLSLLERTVPTTRTDYGRGPGGFLAGQVHDPIAAMQNGVSGNAGLFSTAADLSRFAQMMLDGGALADRRILSRHSVEAMTRVQNPGATDKSGKENRRGLGWDIYEVGPQSEQPALCYGHTGYTGTALRLYPASGVYAIVLTNRVHPDDSGNVGRIRQVVWDMAADLKRR